MGIYVRRKCPKCGYTLENFTQDYTAIGPPFAICPYCKAIIILDHINEWGLMSFGDKAKYLFLHFYSNLVWGLGIAILLMMLIILVFKLDINYPSLYEHRTILGLTGFSGLFLTFAAQTMAFTKTVLRSMKRMRDPEYQKILQQYLEMEFSQANESTEQQSGENT